MLPRGEAACLLAFPRSGDGCRAKPCLARRGTGSRGYAPLDNPALPFSTRKRKRKSMRPDSLWTNPLDCPFGKWGARIPRSWGAGWLFLCLASCQRARLIHFPNGRGICLRFVWPPCCAAWVSSSFGLREGVGCASLWVRWVGGERVPLTAFGGAPLCGGEPRRGAWHKFFSATGS